MPSRLTFAQVLNSTLPKALGLCAQDRTDVAAYVNSATERLVMDPLAPDEGWWGGWATMLFNLNVVNHTATLRTPREIARVIVLDICNRPRFIRNGFYEYLQFSTGHQPKNCRFSCCATQQAFERDDVSTLVPFPTTGPQNIRVYPTDAADTGKRVVIQGIDQNGLVITSTDPVTGGSMQGEVLNLQLPFVTTLNKFQAEPTGIIKDVTKGSVSFFTVDSGGNQTALSSMEYNETTAGYRVYFFNGLPAQCCQSQTGIVQVYAQCKLDFVPVFADTDFVLIQSIEALTEECQSLRYSRMDSPQSPALEAKHHNRAIQLLNGQLDHFVGKSRTAISVPLFGSDRLQTQPV